MPGPGYPLGQAEFLTFRVHESVKGNLGELVEVRYPAPSFPRGEGEEIAAFLHAADGGFDISFGCGDISPKQLRVAKRGGPRVKRASDGADTMTFRLVGRRLTVRVVSYPPRRVRRALRRRIKFICGNYFPLGPGLPRLSPSRRRRRPTLAGWR